MKPARVHSLLVLSVLLASAGHAAPTPAQSEVVRQHIDDLLRLRRNPQPLPIDPPNPFVPNVPAGALVANREAAATPGRDPAAETRGRDGGTTSAEVLARFASRVHITGLIRLKDQVHVIVNDSPFKEGDAIVVDHGPPLVQLQVARIQPGQVTLRLDDAELVLKF